jgi:energy-converting hydrogenase Eha subunit H
MNAPTCLPLLVDLSPYNLFISQTGPSNINCFKSIKLNFILQAKYRVFP